MNATTLTDMTALSIGKDIKLNSAEELEATLRRSVKIAAVNRGRTSMLGDTELRRKRRVAAAVPDKVC